ncbi:MAG: phytoene desaturase [Geodermatophilaceae bacterium]|nr:phytoene desaturase [Geodermatophilaceae bacterium]
MRRVVGRTDHVVVVGAGLAGLSAALRLAGAGRQVTLLEREHIPGGRAGRVSIEGYEFDTGPTVLTMPELIEDALDCVGERMADWLDLRPVRPAYRGFFPDGSTLDVHADVEEMAAEVERVAGAAEAAGYRRFVRFVSKLYAVEMRHFVDRNMDSPLSLSLPAIARLVALGGVRRLAPKVGQYLKDPRLRRLFTFQAMYAGLSPYDALALYAVIAYMDSVAGVFVPVGGMHAVPAAMAGAAVKHGVDIRYGRGAESVVLQGNRATGVVTADGELMAADAVVLTVDLPVAYPTLLDRRPARSRRFRYSPSCVLIQVGSRATYRQLAHHNIHFGRSWRDVFGDLIDHGRLMQDPSLLVTNATCSDPSLAPTGKHTYYVLAPAPHTGWDIDWEAIGPRYRDELLSTMDSRGYVGFEGSVEVERVVTPADWESMGLAAGAPFSLAHTPGQTGPFRPSNIAPGLDNVVFAGSATHPGVGVPMVLISGRLAAERVTGPDPTYRSRAWRPT